VLLALLPAAAYGQSFEAVDTLPYPSTSVFPAYPGEPEGPRAFFAQLGMLYDNNILRRPAGVRDELVTRLGLGVRQDVRVVGRQTLRLEARGDIMLYQQFGDLDHIAYGALAEWRWEAGNQLAGTLGLRRRQFQADLSETQAAVHDLITENRLYGTGAYRFAPDWRVRGGLDLTSAERPRRADVETRGSSATGGIDYVTPLGNALGLEVRVTRGDAPVPEELVVTPGTFVDNDFKEREVAAVAVYNPGPTLRTAGRIGQTRREYTQLPGRDFSGGTGSFSVEWLPGNKTILGFEAYKRVSSILDVAASHIVTKGVSFGPSWAATAKLVFTARLVNEDRDFEGDPNAVAGAPLRSDSVRTVRLGAGWEITRQVQLGFALERGARDSNILGRDYQYTAAMANARYNF